jgi:hypothetical protein
MCACCCLICTLYFQNDRVLRKHFCICEADILLSQTYRTVPYRTVPYRTVPYRTVPYRMLAHRHAATSLYNLSQSAIMLHRVRQLTCERAWFLPRVIQVFTLCLPFWHRFWLQKYLDFILNWPSCFLAILLAKLFRSYLSTWKLILIWYVIKYHIFLLHIF